MAGKGPPPKQGSTRRRSNKPARGDWVVLTRHVEKVPPLPRPYPKGGWSPQAKRAWKAWWSSPMAAMWDESDRDTVELLLAMVHEVHETMTGAITTQIRMFKESLGLTPKGRQDRRWVMPREMSQEPDLQVIDGGGEDTSNVRRLRAVDKS